MPRKPSMRITDPNSVQVFHLVSAMRALGPGFAGRSTFGGGPKSFFYEHRRADSQSPEFLGIDLRHRLPALYLLSNHMHLVLQNTVGIVLPSATMRKKSPGDRSLNEPRDVSAPLRQDDGTHEEGCAPLLN